MANLKPTSFRSQPFADCSSRAVRQPRVLARASNVFDGAESIERRSALLAGSAAILAPLIFAAQVSSKELAPGRSLIPVKSLNSFQKNAERAAFLQLVEGELKKGLKPEDAADTLRLALHDAGTYDIKTGTGGLNGSIRFSEELDRPENASLKPIVEKLKSLKAKIDEKTANSYGAISWADLEVLSVKVANEAAWRVVKKARGVPSSGDVISTAFGAAWPVKLGRVDAEQPDPENRLPKLDASVPEVTEFFARLNNKDYGSTGFFAPKPIFDQRQTFILYGSAQPDVEKAEARLASESGFNYKDFKAKYDRSKATVTRTDYEVDFIDYFNQLAGLGAKFSPEAYLVPIEIDTPRL